MITQKKVSKKALIAMAIIAYAIFTALQSYSGLNPQYKDKINSAHIMQTAIHAIQKEMIYRGLSIDLSTDPNGTGLIGPKDSSIVTSRGILDAKLMTTNPNFAAVIVDMLYKANIRRGDYIAIAYTGSMPGANIAVLSACQAMSLNIIPITSLGSSSWGASHEDFTWLDMESHLVQSGIYRQGSYAASMGGSLDITKQLSDQGRNAIELNIIKHDIEFIYENSIEESVERRIEIYNTNAKQNPIKAFINVGGGIASLGTRSNGSLILPGLNASIDTSHFVDKGLMIHMAKRNIPIIHLLKIREIIRDYELSRFPVPVPTIGEGKLYQEEAQNSRLTLLMTLILIVIFVIIIELDIYGGSRLRGERK